MEQDSLSPHAESDMSTNFESLFSPYFSLQMGSFDNLKLVVALLTLKQQNFDTYELTLPNQKQPFYAVKWLSYWINCGQVNQYNVSLQLFDGSVVNDQVAFATANATLISVPIMNMQQVEFMCLEHAHFDHC
ncbi:hypothetical protein [Shewanella gaetbuli]|uniref:Uncharacterized protein n=1 Tax=Shewanella gaetbuli TaxID=220752 RepID=A0A9X1ZKQ0_9GAMM|nr:hypothetical protein [Shewanella gaetbuli]MCL1141265.1 hypothetical protein [Shewanella gaetbuli]